MQCHKNGRLIKQFEFFVLRETFDAIFNKDLKLKGDQLCSTSLLSNFHMSVVS